MVLNWKAVLGILGILLLFLAGALVAPLVVSFMYGEEEWWSFAVVIVLSIMLGLGMRLLAKSTKKQLEIREGFAVVALSWFVLSLIGALPFVISGVLPAYADAFFETMSGFTTTGATILGGRKYPSNRGFTSLFSILEKLDALAWRDGHYCTYFSYHAGFGYRRCSVV